MVPIPDPNVSIGNAKEMSRYDIERLNKLYKCCEWFELFYFKQYLT